MTQPAHRLGRLALAALFVPLTACDQPSPGTRYDCQAKGESFRYRDGHRKGTSGPDAIAFTLTLRTDRSAYEFSANDALPEMRQPRALLDKTRSSEAEVVYLHDAIDPVKKQRVVTSLVLNTVSGDVRVFHHRWTPPVEWRDSDQYLYTGNCLKAKA